MLLNGLDVVLRPYFVMVAVCAIRIGASVTDNTHAVAQASSALQAHLIARSRTCRHPDYSRSQAFGQALIADPYAAAPGMSALR